MNKSFACVLIILAALTACGQAHSVQRRSLDVLLGKKLGVVGGLLEKKLSLLGLKGQQPVYQQPIVSYGGQPGGYAGGYGAAQTDGYTGGLLEKKLSLLGLKGQQPVYQQPIVTYGGQPGGYAGGYGYAHAGFGAAQTGGYTGGLLEKKLSLLGLKGQQPVYQQPIISYGGYAGGQYNGHAAGYSSNPEKVVIVKVVSDGGYVGNSGGNGRYYAGSPGGGHGGYNSEIIGGHGVYYNRLSDDHIVTHSSSSGC